MAYATEILYVGGRGYFKHLKMLGRSNLESEDDSISRSATEYMHCDSSNDKKVKVM